MKKTLFLSALLSAALCSSAFGSAEGFINESAYGWVYYMTADNQTIESISKDEASFKIWADNADGSERLTETVTNLSIGEGKTVTVEHSGWGGNARYFKLLTVDTLSAANNSALVVTDGNVVKVNNVSGSLKAMTIGNDSTDDTTYTDKDTTLTLTNGATLTGMLSFRAGNLNVTGGTFTAGSFDMNCTGNKAAGQMNLSGTAKASTNTMWLGHNAAITLADGAQFSFNSKYSISALDGKSATLTRNDNAGGSYSIGDGKYTISNAAVTILANDIALGNKLDGVTLDGTGKNVTLSGAVNDSSLKNVTMSGQNLTGSVNLDAVSMTGRLNVLGHVTMQNGVTNTYSNEFAMIVGNTSAEGTGHTLTFSAGVYDLSQHDKSIAVYKGNSMVVQNGATVDVKAIYYGSAWENNGTVTVDAGGKLNILSGGSSATHVGQMVANGTVSVANNLNSNTSLLVGEAASYTQSNGTVAMNSFMDLAANATVTLSGNGSVNVKGTEANYGVWMKNGSKIKFTGTGSLTVALDSLTIAADDSADSYITSSGNGQIGAKGDSLNALLTFHNTKLTINGTELRKYNVEGGSVTVAQNKTATIKSALSNTTALVLNSGSSVSFNGNASVASVSGSGAAMTLNHNLTVKGDASIGTLTLNSGASIDTTAHNGTLTTTTLTVNSDTAINANLVVNDHGTLDFSSGHTLTMGCTVTIGDEVTVIISDEVQEYINRGEAMTIMYGVDNATLESITMGNVHFIMNGVERPDFFFVTEEDTVNDGMKLMVAPEPATATLSLLALAALAARRKRK